MNGKDGLVLLRRIKAQGQDKYNMEQMGMATLCFISTPSMACGVSWFVIATKTLLPYSYKLPLDPPSSFGTSESAHPL